MFSFPHEGMALSSWRRRKYHRRYLRCLQAENLVVMDKEKNKKKGKARTRGGGDDFVLPIHMQTRNYSLLEPKI